MRCATESHPRTPRDPRPDHLREEGHQPRLPPPQPSQGLPSPGVSPDLVSGLYDCPLLPFIHTGTPRYSPGRRTLDRGVHTPDCPSFLSVGSCLPRCPVCVSSHPPRTTGAGGRGGPSDTPQVHREGAVSGTTDGTSYKRKHQLTDEGLIDGCRRGPENPQPRGVPRRSPSRVPSRS